MFNKMIEKLDFDILTDDRRKQVKHTNYPYPPLRVDSLEEWKQKQEEIIARIQYTAGLALEKDGCKPLSVQVTGVNTVDGIRVENVALELFEGFYVTGNLYRPETVNGTIPAILSPHGHWDNGRFERTEAVDVPIRCANFAKMGMACFSYDMIGYGDSSQMGHFDHFPKEAIDWQIGHFSLQLLSSICALEYLQALSYVDNKRIGITGASGGATQALFLAAIDDRIAACAPVCMISYHMQGGCVCENAPGLRYDTNNVELAATIAPRPMHIVGCSGDWTYSNEWREKPDIEEIYKLYQRPENLEFTKVIAEHNYNQEAREAVYNFFNRVFLQESTTWQEQEMTIPMAKQRRVFPNGLPNGALKGVDAITNKWIERRSQVKLTEKEALQILDNTIGARKIKGEDYHLLHQLVKEDYELSRVATGGDHRLVSYIINKANQKAEKTLIIIAKDGAKEITKKEESRIKEACNQGFQVILPTLIHIKDDQEANYFKDPKEHEHYSCYNYSIRALDIQDVVLAVRTFSKGKTQIIGLGEGEEIVLASMPYIKEQITD